MFQFAPPTTARQGSVTPLSVTDPDLRLDVEVLAERYEALLLLEQELREDEPTEEPDDTADEPPTADDLPF